jgi:hypothetical protein
MKSEDTNNTLLNHNNIPKVLKKVKLGEVADLSKIPWKVVDMVGEITSNMSFLRCSGS